MGKSLKIFTVLLLLHLSGFSEALFVPEQLTTLLSFLYTNIPPIRKGTDSRVGFGFRVGPNADFQVLFELGPQANTAPVGPNSDSPKRDTAGQQPPKTWLETWHKKQQELPYDETENETVQRKNIMPNTDIISHLRQLYTTEAPQEKETESPKNTTNSS